jgi:DNA-binding transcriptional LysR family regulator
MDYLAAFDMLAATRDGGSFAAAARLLGLTPAAVGKQMARLEQDLGVPLTVRTTRRLHLTDAARHLLEEGEPALRRLRQALEAVRRQEGPLSGVLRLSLAPAFGRQYVLPAAADFLTQHPALTVDWLFENRRTDLVAEGFDASISGGVDLPGGLISRPFAPLHLVLVAVPGFCGRRPVETPEDLAGVPTAALRPATSGRVRPWDLQAADGRRVSLTLTHRLLLSDPEAVCDAALCGYAVALTGLSHALPHLESGRLERILPDWWGDAGMLSYSYPASRQPPRRTRLFGEHLLAYFRRTGLARRLDAGPAGTG